MAIAVKQPQRNNISGSRITAYLEVTLDNSYPTGGYALNLSDYVPQPEQITISQGQLGGTKAVTGFVFEYQDHATAGSRTIMGFEVPADPQTGPALPAGELSEIANATDLTDIVLKITVTGRR